MFSILNTISQVGLRFVVKDTICSKCGANETQFETVTPFHCFLSVSGKAGEHLVGIPAQVVAYGYHGGVHKCETCASPEIVEVQEEHHLEEHSILLFHEAVIGHRIREVTFEVNPDKMQIVVLKVKQNVFLCEAKVNKNSFPSKKKK